MFFNVPLNSGLGVSNGTGKWERTYPMLVAGVLHPATVIVLYIHPSYEILDVEVVVDPQLSEHRMFEYASQMITQQGVAEYLEWADGQRKQKKSDDPLFEEEHNGPTRNA